jgi:hypothetical protein
MFHIHVDAHTLSKEFENFLLKNLSFFNTNFSGHPEEVPHYETPIHLTNKTNDGKDFKKIFDAIVEYLDNHPGSIEGYVEGEYIPLDIDIEAKPFNPEVEIPCQFELTDLPVGTFREDEIHITLDSEKSDPRLIKNLRKMGFFSAYMEKSFGTVEILTVQGTIKQIEQVLEPILHYLKDAGGAVKCSVKEERIIRWWVSSHDLKLPPVIN